MQGKQPASGTAASLYAQQTQNASLNTRGLFDAFKSFRRRRDVKIMQTIQQYYNSVRHLELSGKDYSEEAKYYNPEKVQNAQIDLKITEGSNSPTYQMVQNDFLMQLFQQTAIDVKTMLENCSYPFATRILESIKRNEQEMQQQQGMSGVPQDAMPQQGNAMMRQAMSGGNAGAMDGQVMRAS